MKSILIAIVLLISIGIQAQNVGIGVTTPTSKLDILDNNPSNSSALHVLNNTAVGTGVFSSSNGGFGVYGESGGVNGIGGYFTTFGNDPNSKALKAETTFPGTIAAYLTAPSGNALIVDQGNVGVGFTSGVVPQKFTVRQFGIGIAQEGVAGGPQIGLYASSISAYLQTHNNFDLSFSTNNGSQQMVLQKGTGNLGIANNNPSTTLDVGRGSGTGGTAAFRGTTHVTHINFSTTEDTYIRGGKTGSLVNINDSHNGNVLIANGGGNVGIGTINPTYKLSVNGNVRSKEIVVETGWADYVFDKKYKRLPLYEVEKYIAENNHLPNVPSAKEIQTNGLKVGEMQTKMMEKIEELTLYVIDLKKEIDVLKAKNNL